MVEQAQFNEAEVQALKELVEVAVELKKSGILGLVKDALKDTEYAFSSLLSDPSLLRLSIFLGAILEASRKIDGSQVAPLKKTVEDTTFCLLDSLSKTEPAKAEPRGLMGLMSALRDPDVQKGLGFLIALAKNLGGCLNRLEKG